MRKMKRMMMVVGLIYVLSKMTACGEDTNISSVGVVTYECHDINPPFISKAIRLFVFLFL